MVQIRSVRHFLLKNQVRLKLWEFLDRYQIPALRDTTSCLIDVEQTISIEKEGFALRGKMIALRTVRE